MACGCGKKSTRYAPKTEDYYSKYAFLTPAQLAAKKAAEAAKEAGKDGKQ